MKTKTQVRRARNSEKWSETDSRLRFQLTLKDAYCILSKCSSRIGNVLEVVSRPHFERKKSEQKKKKRTRLTQTIEEGGRKQTKMQNNVDKTSADKLESSPMSLQE